MAKNKKKVFGIVGLGRFGMALATALADAEEEVIAIDEKDTNISRASSIVDEAFLVGKLTKEALEETGIHECDTVVICIAKVDVSVLTTQILLELGVPRVISKADSRDHGAILEKIGADVVYPEIETATRLATILLDSEAIDLMRLNDNYVISEIKIPQRRSGVSIEALNLKRYNLKLIAVEREPNKTFLNFENEEILYNDDAIVVMGKFCDVERFEKKVII